MSYPPDPREPASPYSASPYRGSQYAASPYAASPYATDGPVRPTNVLAIIALVSSFFIPPAGIVCGHLALGQIARTGESGRGLAMSGLIIGYISTGLILLVIIASIALPLVLISIFGASTMGYGY